MIHRSSLVPRWMASPALALVFFFATSVVAAPAWSQCFTTCSTACVVDGSGGGDRTTIQAAVDDYKASACSGETIEVRAGTYAESVQFFGVVGPLTIDADSGMALAPGSARGFEFRNSSFITLHAQPGAAIVTGTNEPIALQGGSAANNDIYIWGWDIHDNGGGKDSACIDSASGNLNVTIENVICRDNGSTAIHLAAGTYEVINNTVVRNDKHGILLEQGAVALVKNNLVAFNGTSGGTQYNITISRRASAADVTLTNNIAYEVDGDIDGPYTDGGGNLTSADMALSGKSIGDFFVDPAGDDFHLVAGSPAADVAGIAAPFPPTDFEGDLRGAPGDPVDIGYDELILDLDLDGIADIVDNCPPISGQDGSISHNPGQEDLDMDGLGDRCDPCWGDPLDECETEHLAGACPVVDTNGDCPVLSAVKFTSAQNGTLTVPAACEVNLRFNCTRDGVPIPLKFFDFSLLSENIEFVPAGQETINTCNLSSYLPPAAFVPDPLTGTGLIECEIFYVNDIKCDASEPDGGCGGVDPVFQGEVPSGIVSVVLGDPSANDEACSPGFFKNDLTEWATTGLTPTDSFDATFGTSFIPGLTLLDALNLGGGDVNLLARRGVSGLLSSLHTGILFPLSENQVRIIVRDAIDDNSPGEATAAAQLIPVSATSAGGCPL